MWNEAGIPPAEMRMIASVIIVFCLGLGGLLIYAKIMGNGKKQKE